MPKRVAAIAIAILFCTVTLVLAQSGNDLFQQAVAKERADGDYEGAIQIYQRILRDFSKERLLVAKALLQLGGCYERLGQSKARGYYERLIAEYVDQKDLVAEARSRLAGAIKDTSDSRVEITTPFSSDLYSFAISPDGRSLVYQVTKDGASHLWLQDLMGGKAGPIAGTEDAGASAYPFWSPDGRSIGFFADGKMKRIPVGGGTPKVLADAPFPVGGAWGSAGVILYAPEYYGPLYRVPENGGVPTLATDLGSGTSHRWPQFLPDGRRFIFNRGAGQQRAEYWAGSLDSTTTRTLSLPGDRWSRSFVADQLWYSRNGELFVQSLDRDTLEVKGDAVKVTDRVATNSWGPLALSVSNAGRIALRAEGGVDRQFVWLDRRGQVEKTLGVHDRYRPQFIRISPDGQRAVLSRSAPDQGGGGGGGAWGILGSGDLILLVSPGTRPVWSPDGTFIAMGRMENEVRFALWQQRVSSLDGLSRSVVDNEKKYLLQTCDSLWPNDWSRNGFLLYEGRSQALSTAPADLFALPLSGGEPIVVAQTSATERNGRFSPDGKWVVYESNEVGGRFEVFVQPFPGSTAQRRQVSTGGGVRPVWGRGGSEIYFMSPDDHLMVAEAKYLPNGHGVEIKSPAPLFAVPLPTTSEFDTIDGERFLVNMPTQESTPIIVLSGWPGKK